MGKHRHDHGSSHHGSGAGTGRRRFPMAAVGLALGAILGVAIFAWAPFGARRSGPVPTPSPARPSSSPSEAAVKADPQKLVGRWLRPDGGYVLEIKRVGGDRKLEVEYLNPRPINVARAEMEDDGTRLRVLVELRDSGYPGCIYKLVYDPGSDQLNGSYYQAALQETFDVRFTRLK